MKTLERLKLNQLSKAALDKREQNLIRGGDDSDNTCNCGCANHNTSSNRDANSVYGYQESDGFGDGNDGYVYCICHESTMQSMRGGF